MTSASVALHAGCAAVALCCAALVLGAGRGWRAALAAGVCLAVTLWAATVALQPGQPLGGLAGLLDILRAGLAALLLLVLCRNLGGAGAMPLLRRCGIALVLCLVFALGTSLAELADAPALLLPTLGSPALLARFGLAVLVVLLAEILWRNADEASSWHVSLPSIVLGGLATFDIVLYADAVLTRQFSPLLVDVRAVLTALTLPLLVLAAVRDRRWQPEPSLSRSVVFHGATLMVAGTFLFGVGAAGEALRRFGPDWGELAQVSLLAGAMMALVVALATRSVRSRLRRLLVDHFFAARYDYRQEWLRCVNALSAPDREMPAALRAIGAIAAAVDSPAGILLQASVDADAGDHAAGQAAPRALAWTGSWNRKALPVTLAADHPLCQAARHGATLADPALLAPLQEVYGRLWLAVPLLHHREGLSGIVLLAPPRAPFPLDDEVHALLGMLGREVALFLAERRAAERLADGRRLADYAKRFAFVAHDVKTVSSQLSLLLGNAEAHLQDPEFQQDMLLTVRAAASRIDTLIARLRQDAAADAAQDQAPPAPAGQAPALVLLPRLQALVRPRGRSAVLVAGPAAASLQAAVHAEIFEAVVTHLLDNAIEASPPGTVVQLALQAVAGRIRLDIIDQGPGMTAEFIRDRLFRPLHTTKPQGSGIGAWQARELLHQAGGALEVLSRPGEGTTMRILLPALPDGAAASGAGHPAERLSA